MKRFSRSRKGFTLAEIILVVAIIVILASAAAVGVVEKINKANAQAEAVQLHASGGVFWTVEGGKVVQLSPEEYDPSNPNHKKGGMMDMQFDEVKYIQGTVPNNPPQTYNPGGGDPIGPGTGDPGSGGSGSAGHHTQSASDMLKEFLEHYGIPYTENGGSITWDHDGDYGGQSFTDAWNQWKKDHTNSTGGGSSSGGNNVSTGGSGSSGSGSGSTGGSGSSDSRSSGSGSSGSESTGSGAITVPKTVNSGTGVKEYTNNTDGTTTATLILNTYNTGDVKFRTNSDGTHSIYCVGNDGKTVVGNVINYTADNQYCNADTWIKLTPGDWNKLSTTYGFS